jgi:hypothetical protein
LDLRVTQPQIAAQRDSAWIGSAAPSASRATSGIYARGSCPTLDDVYADVGHLRVHLAGGLLDLPLIHSRILNARRPSYASSSEVCGVVPFPIRAIEIRHLRWDLIESTS